MTAVLEPALGKLLDLGGRVAVVSGGAGAIGSAICARLLECGASVFCLDLDGRTSPAGADFLPCDMTDPDSIVRAVSEVDQRAQRLDILVHAAGVTRDARVWKATRQDWDLVMATNLSAAFNLVRAAVPVMRRVGAGSIVFISSINGERGKIGQAAYAASKAGLNALARTAARELGAFGIRVNAVAPGWIETPMTSSLPDSVRQRAVDETALGRVGMPDDVARVTMVLASELGRHVTGQVIRVDGGQLIG